MKTAFAFSGGKDSWACLWLNKDRLHEIDVLWVNTGKNYPELLKTIDYAKTLCPNFIELTSDQATQNKEHGIPSDVVPINWTQLGQIVTTKKPVLVQSYLQCCYENIGKQIMDYCAVNGVTHLIKGQRNSETHVSTSRDGDIVNGIVIMQPIETWSSGEVLNYVAEHMPLPEHFKMNHSSMDCYDCTAYKAESQDRISFTKQHHPALFAEYEVRNDALKNALFESLKDMS